MALLALPGQKIIVALIKRNVAVFIWDRVLPTNVVFTSDGAQLFKHICAAILNEQ